jgi:dTDP-glucose pyrophosphorylase
MAGAGTRFKEAGYTDPKPLIDVDGMSMIQTVIYNFSTYDKSEEYHIIYNENEIGHQELGRILGYNIRWKLYGVTELTEGPAASALLAEINPELPLLIVNCDQVINDFSWGLFLKFCQRNDADGVIGCFISTSPKNSYVRLNDDGEVCEVREKEVISNMATNGLHYWRRGGDFIESANAMIEAGDKQAGEYYIAPTYNYLISQGKKVLPYFFNLHYPIGTPEDLQRYQQLHGKI